MTASRSRELHSSEGVRVVRNHPDHRHSSLRLQVAPPPNERWMMQIGRNLTDGFDGFFQDKHFVIMDRDSKYTDAFRNLLTRAGVRAVRLPARSPNLNAWIERFIRSIKEECLDRMFFFGEASLRRAVR